MLHFFQLFLVGLIFQLTQAQYYYLNKNKMNYNDAVKYCNSKNMDLVKITDSQTGAAVFELASKNGIVTYWMNGNDIAKEGTWVDTKNKPLVYKNWYSGEPNNAGGNENCIHGAFSLNKMWNDIDCNSLNSVICEIVVDDYHINKNKMKYNEAVKYCNERKMDLVRIPNAELDVAIYEYAAKNAMGTYWMNGNDIDKEGTWVDTNNKPLVYKNWYSGEPNNAGGKENCLHGAFSPNKMWNDIDCNGLNSVICEVVEENYHINKNKMKYKDAVKYCDDRSMDLVKIPNSEVNVNVYNLALKHNLGTYWMNGNDITKEGTWVDTENKPLVYKNWYTGEPNNWGGNENCLHGAFSPNKMWNDIDCNSLNSVICEIVIDNFHFNKNKMKYEDALKYCNDREMDIVRISNAETNMAIYNAALKNGLGTYWINADDIEKEGDWCDSNNKQISYKNWFAGEPNNAGGNENCVQGMFSSSAMWNDIDCNSLNSVVCEYYSDDYHISNNKMNYSAAVAYCYEKHMDLLRIESAEANAFVYDLVLKNGIENYWINGNDNAREGVWVDVKTHPLQYKNWNTGEPNNAYGKENCIHGLVSKNGMWNDIDCASTNAVICYDDECD